jgi:formylglycine-generating enzyme required for sulfatase activity
MLCPQCAATITGTPKFCPECGHRFAAAAPVPLSVETSMGAVPSRLGETTLGESSGIATSFGERPAEATFTPGEVFDGRYALLRRLGKGGMGTVYRAMDQHVENDVAIKVLHPHVAQNPEYVRSLAREVQLAQQLNHPNLLSVRHFEMRAGIAYVVMELMDGGDVAELAASKGGKLAEAEALRLVDGVLAGLEALHGARLAHLDVKPQNVLLSRDGVPKLADFGVSSRLGDRKGQTSGTPAYAPPEQLRGEPCDVRADLYAVGMMLHELMAGTFPFERTEAAARAWHERGERVFPLLPIGIGRTVAKCLAVSPDQRFRTAAEVRAALKSGGAVSVATTRTGGWYAVPESTVAAMKDRLSDTVLVEGAEWKVPDPMALLSSGAARPGWRTRGGLVTLETHALALISCGHEVPAGPAWLEAGRAALKGDLGPLMSLGTQPPTIEARLAVAALIGGDRDEAQIRLARAAGNARSTGENLAVIEAMLRGLGNAEERRGPLNKAIRAAASVKESAELAVWRAFLLDDASGSAESVKSAEKQAPGTLELAQLLAAVRAPIESLDACVEALRTRDESGSQLVVAAEALGARSSVIGWVDALGAPDREPSSWLVAAKAWRALGKEARAKALDDRWNALQTALEARLEAARRALESTGFKLREVARPLSEATVSDAERLAASEVAAHPRAASVAAAEREVFIESKAWTRPYTERELAARAEAVKREHAAAGEAARLDVDLQAHGYQPMKWSRPYREAEFDAARKAIAKVQAERKAVAERQALERKIAAEKQKAAELAAQLQPMVEASQAVANDEAVKRILAFAAGTMPLEASAKYAATELGGDIATVQGATVDVRRVSAREWDEEVVEQLPTGETRKAFFGLMERPVMREERRTVRRRGPEEERWVLSDYFGREVPTNSIHALDAGRKQQGGKPVIVRIPPGKFVMGAGADDPEALSDEKRHEVTTISRGFEIWSVPVTQAQYEAVMKANPSHFKGPNRPVENVSWFDAVKYCNALSRAQGLPEAYEISGSGDTPDVKWRGLNHPGWRLPTEAEWEYACRAGTTAPRYGPIDEVAWYDKNSGLQTHDVATKKANPWGLYDMLGNVWEWTGDWYGAYGDGVQVDPEGRASGSDRVGRGGSWFNGALFARAACRINCGVPSGRGFILGFRPTRSLTK